MKEMNHSNAGNAKSASLYFLIDSSDSFVAVFGSKTKFLNINKTCSLMISTGEQSRSELLLKSMNVCKSL